MQREKFHGLTVDYTEDKSERWYALKASLAEATKNMKNASVMMPDKTFIIGTQITSSLHLTICAQNRQVEFGLYNKENKTILDHIDSDTLAKIRLREMDHLEYRSQNVIDAIKYGRQIPNNWEVMQPAWEKAIQERSRDSVSQEFDDRIKQAKQEAKQLSSGTNNIKVKGQEKER